MFHELQATDNSLSGWNSFLFLFNHSNGLEYYFLFWMVSFDFEWFWKILSNLLEKRFKIVQFNRKQYRKSLKNRSLTHFSAEKNVISNNFIFCIRKWEKKIHEICLIESWKFTRNADSLQINEINSKIYVK